MLAFLSLIVAQGLYTVSDTMKKLLFNEKAFSFGTLTSYAFLVTMGIALTGFLFQMFALSKMELSRTIITMGVLAVVFSAVAGMMFLDEQLNWWNWMGVGLAASAIVLVNMR